jgi:hypothetical protein
MMCTEAATRTAGWIVTENGTAALRASEASGIAMQVLSAGGGTVLTRYGNPLGVV